MIINTTYKIITIALLFAMNAYHSNAQEPQSLKKIEIVDDLGDVSDMFQESFFEALKQKAINNHEKAISALERCISTNPKPVILYFELSKNYLALKQYDKAAANLKKVQLEKPNDRHILELLFEVYFAQYKYKESIEVVEKLVVHNPMFKEQLANLYFLEKRYDDALNVLDELNDAYGTDSYRSGLRKRISLKITNPNSQIGRLEKKIEENPGNEQNYLNLIYLYSQDNQKEKAYEAARQLLKKKPKSQLVHLALYKFYLDDNKTEPAIKSMKIALKSDQLDDESKYKVINDFLLFVKDNPQYESQLTEIANLFSKDQNNAKVFTELGHFYYKKEEKEKALNYYERGLKDNATDFALIKRIILLQLDLKRYEKAKAGSELALEMYPSQPVFYLANGVSLIQLNEAEKAIDILSSGVDYVLDDLKMESDFYQQMSAAYQILGDTTKATRYKEKAIQLQKNYNG